MFENVQLQLVRMTSMTKNGSVSRNRANQKVYSLTVCAQLSAERRSSNGRSSREWLRSTYSSIRCHTAATNADALRRSPVSCAKTDEVQCASRRTRNGSAGLHVELPCCQENKRFCEHNSRCMMDDIRTQRIAVQVVQSPFPAPYNIAESSPSIAPPFSFP